MSKFILSQRSLDRLQGVHPDLVSVVKKAITLTKVDFCVAKGLRTLEEQKEAVANKKSQTLDGRHLQGFAVDLALYVDGHMTWSPKDWFLMVGDAMKMAAKELNVPIIWGKDWKGKAAKLGDWGHFELPEKQYPNHESAQEKPQSDS